MLKKQEAIERSQCREKFDYGSLFIPMQKCGGRGNTGGGMFDSVKFFFKGKMSNKITPQEKSQYSVRTDDTTDREHIDIEPVKTSDTVSITPNTTKEFYTQLFKRIDFEIAYFIENLFRKHEIFKEFNPTRDEDYHKDITTKINTINEYLYEIVNTNEIDKTAPYIEYICTTKILQKYKPNREFILYDKNTFTFNFSKLTNQTQTKQTILSCIPDLLPIELSFDEINKKKQSNISEFIEFTRQICITDPFKQLIVNYKYESYDLNMSLLNVAFRKDYNHYETILDWQNIVDMNVKNNTVLEFTVLFLQYYYNYIENLKIPSHISTDNYAQIYSGCRVFFDHNCKIIQKGDCITLPSFLSTTYDLRYILEFNFYSICKIHVKESLLYQLLYVSWVNCMKKQENITLKQEADSEREIILPIGSLLQCIQVQYYFENYELAHYEKKESFHYIFILKEIKNDNLYNYLKEELSKQKGGKGGKDVIAKDRVMIKDLYKCNDGRLRKAFRIKGRGNTKFVTYKGKVVKASDIPKKIVKK
jgi:hypothetical protein